MFAITDFNGILSYLQYKLSAEARTSTITSTMEIWEPIERLTAYDGWSVSVQANMFTYCQPRVNPNKTKAYTHVELGYPSKVDRKTIDRILLPYVEDEGAGPTDTVYPYVPIEVAALLFYRHGGICVTN